MVSLIELCKRAVGIALNRNPPNRAEAIAAIDRYIRDSTGATSQVDVETPVGALGVSVRVLTFLEDNGILTLGALERCTAEELLGIENFGPKCLEDTRACMAKVGRRLRGETFVPSMSKARETLQQQHDY